MVDPLSRRRFLNLVGRSGGAAAAYNTMAAMGLLAVPAAYAGPPDLAPGSGSGIKVAVIGAGIAGLVAAFELKRAGYDVTVLEARARPGGRTWTLRGGDEIVETGSTQAVAWEPAEHLYFNPGPARIPYHHEGILSYCRLLQVPLAVMVNDNRAAYFQDDAAFGGKPQRARAVVSDARGVVAELAAKALDQSALDHPLATEDKERVRAFLRSMGALDRDLVYRGSSRLGYAEPPGAGEASGTINQPLDIRELLRSEFWYYKMNFAEAAPQAPTMLEPVGGMDRIPRAFARRLGSAIIYGAEVARIERTGDGARILWKDQQNGQTQATDARFVLCTVPASVLRKLDADFSMPVKAALARVYYVPAAKIAFEAKRRFWEEDDGIYGGISWTSRDITQIWYPSQGLAEKSGVLVGAYIWSDPIGKAFAQMPPSERLTAAIASGERIHPGYARELDRGVSVAWPNVAHSEGAWAEWSPETRRDAYGVLIRPDGPFHFAGEHLSYVTGWQEGALRSAHYAVAQIAERVRAIRL